MTVILVSIGICPLAAQVDDGSTPEEAQATTSADDRSDDSGPLTARYLVTFVKSRTTDPLRSATVVSVTNQAGKRCRVAVEWVRGFESPSVCTTTMSLDTGITADLCSRAIPESLTTCNTTCDPDLIFDEGRALVSSSSQKECERIGVSARVYYTTGEDDDDLAAISDSNIVLFGKGNRGD